LRADGGCGGKTPSRGGIAAVRARTAAGPDAKRAERGQESGCGNARPWPRCQGRIYVSARMFLRCRTALADPVAWKKLRSTRESATAREQKRHLGRAESAAAIASCRAAHTTASTSSARGGKRACFGSKIDQYRQPCSSCGAMAPHNRSRAAGHVADIEGLEDGRCADTDTEALE